MFLRNSSCDMYKSVALFFILPIICQTVAIESAKAKTAAKLCGLEKGCAIMQAVTKPFSSFSGLFWDAVQGELLSVSPLDSTTNQYRPKDGNLDRIKVKGLDGQTLVAVIPMKDAERKYILVTHKNLYVYTVSGAGENISYSLQFYQAVAGEGQKIIQAHADSKGRLWLGVSQGLPRSLGSPDDVGNADHGVLLRIDVEDKKTDVVQSKYSYSDFAWDNSNTGLFVVDSRENVIRSYAYDEGTGDIADERIAFNMTVEGKGKVAGRMSSIVTDINGTTWVGFTNSGTVMQYDPVDKTILRTTAIPANDITHFCSLARKDLVAIHLRISS